MVYYFNITIRRTLYFIKGNSLVTCCNKNNLLQNRNKRTCERIMIERPMIESRSLFYKVMPKFSDGNLKYCK